IVSASASAAMMIMASWILAVASGWRPIACMAPWPIRPRPMPEPIAAMPIPSGRPSDNAAWRSMERPPVWVSVSVLRTRLVPVPVVMLVREHEEDVDGAEHREHHRLERAAEQRQRVEQHVHGDAERHLLERQHGHTERRERHQQHVLPEDVPEQSARERDRFG